MRGIAAEARQPPVPRARSRGDHREGAREGARARGATSEPRAQRRAAEHPMSLFRQRERSPADPARARGGRRARRRHHRGDGGGGGRGGRDDRRSPAGGRRRPADRPGDRRGGGNRARRDSRPRCHEGAAVGSETVIGELRGKAAGLLTIERVMLNFLQRMCGVATLTRRYVEAVAGTRAQDRRHAEDRAGLAAPRQVRGRDRRRRQPSLRPRRRRPDQGQPHRRLRRHWRRDRARSAPRASPDCASRSSARAMAQVDEALAAGATRSCSTTCRPRRSLRRCGASPAERSSRPRAASRSPPCEQSPRRAGSDLRRCAHALGSGADLALELVTA